LTINNNYSIVGLLYANGGLMEANIYC